MVRSTMQSQWWHVFGQEFALSERGYRDQEKVTARSETAIVPSELVLAIAKPVFSIPWILVGKIYPRFDMGQQV